MDDVSVEAPAGRLIVLSRNGAPRLTARIEASGTVWLDIASRLLVGGFFAFCAVVYLRAAMAAVRGTDFAHINLEQSANILSILAVAFFVGLVAYLYAVQLPPLTRFAGWRPAAVAGFGSFAMFGLLLLDPCANISPAVRLLSAGLIIAGNLFAIYSLRYLDRSFAILPQARQLVTGGPYRFIRHPIYLAEAISIVGVLVVFLSIEAFVLFLAQLTCQFLRMHYEEKVLGEAFPAYAEYRGRTARVLPGIY